MKKLAITVLMLISINTFAQKNSYGNDRYHSVKDFVQVYTLATGYSCLEPIRVKEMIERGQFGYIKITPELEEFVREKGLLEQATVNKRREIEINNETLPFILDIFRISDIDMFIRIMQG
jgi:hypothetical protein